MAVETAVNAQVTDAVTQSGTQVAGVAPGMALGSLFISVSHALSLAALNAANTQQQNNITAQAVTVRGVKLLLTVHRGKAHAQAAEMMAMLLNK